MATETPIFIVVRDRLSPLQSLLGWLESAGHSRIILLDNASTYPPLLDFLRTTRHTVVRLDKNLGHLAAWTSGAVREHAAGEWYVVTDPDVVPIPECPADAVDRFRSVLCKYPAYIKAGFGLRIDDLPACYKHAAKVVAWEKQFWRRRFAGNLYHADIDTTFALYRPYREDFTFRISPSIRTGFPYVARHLPWYTDSGAPSDEEAYYVSNALAATSNWNQPSLSESMERIIARAPKWTLMDRLRWHAHVMLRMKRARHGDESSA